jgi:tRNA-uridine 2-sulfurtransferase
VQSRNHSKEKHTIFVGLSGGVDSAVSAALLKQQGYDVVGVFMKNWSGDDFGIQADCPWEEDQKMAEMVAAALGIPFKSYNFEKEYRARVVDYFFQEYKAGRTPNPDVMCNREIKFDLFLNKALSEGADGIATGHYVRKVNVPNDLVNETLTSGKFASGNQNDLELTSVGYTPLLLKGNDPNKDQSYFLNAISPEQLGQAIFPIGHLTKPEVRKLAAEFELPNFNRPDSQGICFIGELDVQQLLRAHISTKPGNIVDVDSKKVVGTHDGVYYYTIGQREGLGIGGQETPYFVVGKDVKTNELYVAHGHDHPALNSLEVKLEELHWLIPGAESIVGDVTLTASARYRQQPQIGKLNIDALQFIYDQPQRAITPGQSLVIYAGDVCIGGGVIQ